MSDNKIKDICTGALAASSIVLTTIAVNEKKPVNITSAGVTITSTVVTAFSKKKD